MKKFDDKIEIANTVLLFNNIQLIFGQSIDYVISQIGRNFSIESYIPKRPEYKKVKFEHLQGISIYSLNQAFYKILIELPLPYDKTYFLGSLVINGVSISEPLLSKNIEQIFPTIQLAKVPSIYPDNYAPNYPNDFLIDKSFKACIWTGRDKQYIAMITLEKENH